MSPKDYTPAQKVNRFLRRREIRQARKHNQWLESVLPQMKAATWQSGASSAFQARASENILDDPNGNTVLDENGFAIQDY